MIEAGQSLENGHFLVLFCFSVPPTQAPTKVQIRHQD